MPCLFNTSPIQKHFPIFGLVTLTCLNLCISSYAYSLEKNLSFQDFLNIHYQSQSTALPTIPSYTLISPIILPQPTLAILGPEPQAIPLLRPTLRILGIAEDESVQIDPALNLDPDSQNNFLGTKNTTRANQPKLKNNLPKIAIVIDDIGNNKSLDTRVANLPGAVTLAILPHTPHSKSIADLAHTNHKEIMLHAPMESLRNSRLGDGALTKDLSEEDFIRILQDDIDSIPHIVGLNNHMGSALTQDKEAMHLVMQAVSQNKLYFVDSRTTAESVAGDLATQYKIAHVSRNVFLDNETTVEYIDEAFQQAIRISKKTGFALAIGHPYPNTITYLENILPELEKQGVSLISVSDLLIARAERNKNQQKDLAKN